MASGSKRKREDAEIQENENQSHKTKRGRRSRGTKVDGTDDIKILGEADQQQKTKRAINEEENGAVNVMQTVPKIDEPKKKQEKQHKRLQEAVVVVEDSLQTHNATRLDSDDGPVHTRSQEVDLNGNAKTDHGLALLGSRWTVSQTLGGRIIDADPIFTKAEKYVILAYPSSINIYAMNNSSLVRALPIASSSMEIQITSYALSPTNSSHLYAGTAQGILYHFDWVQGTKLGRWKVGAPIRSVAVTEDIRSGSKADLVYTRDHKGERWWISVHRLQGVGENVKTESGTMLSLSSRITHFEVVESGKIVVVAAGQQLLVGAGNFGASEPLKDMKYVWREVVTPAAITTLDVRVPEPPTERKRSSSIKKLGGSDVVVDVAVGDREGVIHIFDDLHNSLVRQEKQKNSTETPPTPRRMHWHRQAVHSVKWSRDGNYVISGGSETVLVLWQLDTDRCSFLPHLSASIDSIVVSPSGTAYAVRLSDNAMMVLSTSELKPKAYIGGIQSRMILGNQRSAENNSTYHMQHKEITIPTVPAAISTLKPSQLLLAVPSVPLDDTIVGCPFLQTVDLATAHHVSRQALTRTNVTTLNIGPERNRLIEPSVTLIKTSHDGRWLATVDEWSPPARDLEALAADEGDGLRGANQRKEIYLKMWSWNQESQQWELVTRFDGPHDFGDEFSAGRILDLQSDPTSAGFATIGEDYTIRIWGLKTRLRYGQVLQDDKKSTSSKIWFCRQEIPLRRVVAPVMKKAPLSGNSQAIARLAYSADGSVLAASQTGLDEETSGTVFFIDPNSGTIHRVQPMLYTGSLVALGFVERHLVVIGDCMKVWDTVTERRVYGFSLVPPGVNLSPVQRAGMMHLAVDQKDKTFAVSVPAFDHSRQRKRGGKKKHDGDDERSSSHGLRPLSYSILRDTRAHVFVFDPTRSKPLHTLSLPHLVTVLLPLVGSDDEATTIRGGGGGGYVVMDGAAEMRVIRGSSAGVNLSIPDVPNEEDTTMNVNSQVLSMGTNGNGYIGKIDLEASIMNINNDHNGMAEERAAKRKSSGRSKYESKKGDGDGELDDEDDDDDDVEIPVVRQEQLTALFDSAPAYALPSVHDLFERMAELFSKKVVVGSGGGGGEGGGGGRGGGQQKQKQMISSA